MTRDIFNRTTYEPLTGSQRELALLTTSPIGEEVARMQLEAEARIGNDPDQLGLFASQGTPYKEK